MCDDVAVTDDQRCHLNMGENFARKYVRVYMCAFEGEGLSFHLLFSSVALLNEDHACCVTSHFCFVVTLSSVSFSQLYKMVTLQLVR